MPSFENDFERLKYFYEKNWASEDQLLQYVSFGVITQEQADEIMNTDNKS